jgi:hypothetical protein
VADEIDARRRLRVDADTRVSMPSAVPQREAHPAEIVVAELGDVGAARALAHAAISAFDVSPPKPCR